MKRLLLATTLALAACDSPPPCPDQACVAQRQMNMMLMMGFMAQHPVEYHPIPSPIIVPDLESRVNGLQIQVNRLREGY